MQLTRSFMATSMFGSRKCAGTVGALVLFLDVGFCPLGRGVLRGHDGGSGRSHDGRRRGLVTDEGGALAMCRRRWGWLKAGSRDAVDVGAGSLQSWSRKSLGRGGDVAATSQASWATKRRRRWRRRRVRGTRATRWQLGDDEAGWRGEMYSGLNNAQVGWEKGKSEGGRWLGGLCCSFRLYSLYSDAPRTHRTLTTTSPSSSHVSSHASPSHAACAARHALLSISYVLTSSGLGPLDCAGTDGTFPVRCPGRIPQESSTRQQTAESRQLPRP